MRLTRRRCGRWPRRRRCCTSPAVSSAWSICLPRTRSRSSARAAHRPTGSTSPARSAGTWPSPGSRSSAGWRTGSTPQLTPARSRPVARRWRCCRARRTVRTQRGSGLSTGGSSGTGAAVSELGPGTSVRRWMFPARNRVIAALAAMTVVVEAGERSGSLVTARLARGIGRPVGAVPGRVTTPQAAGPNGLLATGACVVRGPQDVLDHLFGAGERIARDPGRMPVPAELRPLLQAIAEGHETTAALARAGLAPDAGVGSPSGARARRVRDARPGGSLPGCDLMRLTFPAILAGNVGRIASGYARGVLPRVLSIAGTDSGAGAGIQADLKAFAACGVHGMTAITAITAQNTVGVTAVHAIPPDVILAQVARGGERHRRRRGQDRDARRPDDDRGGRDRPQRAPPGHAGRARPGDGGGVRGGAARPAGAIRADRAAAPPRHRCHAERPRGQDAGGRGGRRHRHRRRQPRQTRP